MIIRSIKESLSESLNESVDSRELKRCLTSLRSISSKPMAAIVDGGRLASLTLYRVDVDDDVIFCDVVSAKVEGDEVTTKVSKSMGYDISEIDKIVLNDADFNKELRKITDGDTKLAKEITSVLGL